MKLLKDKPTWEPQDGADLDHTEQEQVFKKWASGSRVVLNLLIQKKDLKMKSIALF